MSGWNKWAWAALFAAIAAAPATAQTGGITSGGQTGGVGLGGGSNALSSGSSGTGLGGGTGTGAGGILQPTMLNSNGYAKPTGTANSSLSSDNFLSGYYANPYYAGFGTSFKTAPGGFGSPLYTSSSGTSTTSGGTRTTGTTGVGRTGLTGTTANQSGIVVPLPVQINYTAQMQFSAPAIAPSRIQSDIRAAVNNSSMITSAKNVEIYMDTNNNITLRGKVKDESEARLIEGVIRLTPGVGEIRNELLFPFP